MGKKVKVIASLIIALLIVIYIGQQSIIHKGKLKSVQITNKEEIDGTFYITADDQKLVISDENTWNLISEEERYDLQYEWHGKSLPVVNLITIHGEKSDTKH